MSICSSVTQRPPPLADPYRLSVCIVDCVVEPKLQSAWRVIPSDARRKAADQRRSACHPPRKAHSSSVCFADSFHMPTLLPQRRRHRLLERLWAVPDSGPDTRGKAVCSTAAITPSTLNLSLPKLNDVFNDFTSTGPFRRGKKPNRPSIMCPTHSSCSRASEAKRRATFSIKRTVIHQIKRARKVSQIYVTVRGAVPLRPPGRSG